MFNTEMWSLGEGMGTLSLLWVGVKIFLEGVGFSDFYPRLSWVRWAACKKLFSSSKASSTNCKPWLVSPYHNVPYHSPIRVQHTLAVSKRFFPPCSVVITAH